MENEEVNVYDGKFIRVDYHYGIDVLNPNGTFRYSEKDGSLVFDTLDYADNRRIIDPKSIRADDIKFFSKLTDVEIDNLVIVKFAIDNTSRIISNGMYGVTLLAFSIWLITVMHFLHGPLSLLITIPGAWFSMREMTDSIRKTNTDLQLKEESYSGWLTTRRNVFRDYKSASKAVKAAKKQLRQLQHLNDEAK